MFFKKMTEKKPTKVKFFPASETVINVYDTVDKDTFTTSFPEYKELDSNTWIYNKMEDVPIPENEEWVWVDCYKALVKDYDAQEKKVVFKGPQQDFSYEFNTVYALSETSEENISYCGRGFHACLTLREALQWYNYIRTNEGLTFNSLYTYEPTSKVTLIVVAKVKLLVNKKELDSNFGLEQLQTGKIVGKAIVLTELVNEEEVFYNREKDTIWNVNCYDENITTAFFQSKEFTGNVIKSILKDIPIDFGNYLTISSLIDNGFTAKEAYTKAELATFTKIYKNHKKVLENSFGVVLTTEIFNNLDYRFALQLADTDDFFVNSLSVVEKMQILYSHQMISKK